jgi:hypothetical protein
MHNIFCIYCFIINTYSLPLHVIIHFLILLRPTPIQLLVQGILNNVSFIYLVEEDATRGTTTLVYLQLHISLYTGTVHVLSRVLEHIR